MSDGTDVLPVLTNAPDVASADRVTQLMLESRAAACVNRLSGCVSTYWWNGVLEHTMEIPSLIKTTRAAYSQSEAAVRQAHPYEVSEITAVPVVAGLLVYLARVAGKTHPAFV